MKPNRLLTAIGMSRKLVPSSGMPIVTALVKLAGTKPTTPVLLRKVLVTFPAELLMTKTKSMGVPQANVGAV